MHTLGVTQWPLPGESGFPLNAMYVKPKDRNDEGRSIKRSVVFKPNFLCGDFRSII